ncbi:MAG: ribonuclease P protein component [Dehalococcoidia bacterium]
MQKNFRLTKSSDFADIRRNGKRWSNSDLILIVRHTDLEVSTTPRFGLVVSKKVGNAVIRNKCKRRMREATRHLNIKGGNDLVFIARSSIASKTHSEITKSMSELLSRAKII